jgi:hypothetical protein
MHVRYMQLGLFDRTDERNPYKSYTVVQVLYCSGGKRETCTCACAFTRGSPDSHSGNVTRDYTDDAGEPVVQVSAHAGVREITRLCTQVGIYNAQSVVDWILEQQTKGTLASPLASLVLMGCSAGACKVEVVFN